MCLEIFAVRPRSLEEPASLTVEVKNDRPIRIGRHMLFGDSVLFSVTENAGIFSSCVETFNIVDDQQ